MMRRRKHARQAMRSMQYVDFEGLHGALITDLSEAGAGVLAAVPLRAQQRVRCRLDLGSTIVAAEAQIVSADNTGRAGLQFLAMADEERRRLRDWLFEHALSRGIEMAPAPTRSDEDFFRELEEMIGPIADETPVWDEPQTAVPAPSQPRPPVTLTLADLPPATAPALTRVVRQARECARAHGAAIALARGGVMRCLARDGEIAPDLGVPLDTRASFSGQCIRSAATLVCDDSERDARVDAEVCRQLDIRSILATPVRLAGRVVGVLEIFSSAPQSFGDDDVRDMERLGELLSQFVARETASAARRSAREVVQPAAPPGPPPAAAAAVSFPASSKVTPITTARPAAAVTGTPATTAPPTTTGALAAAAETAPGKPVAVTHSAAPLASAMPAAMPQPKPPVPSLAKAPLPVPGPVAGAESVAQETFRQPVSTQTPPAVPSRSVLAASATPPATTVAPASPPVSTPAPPPPLASAAAAAARVPARPAMLEPERSTAATSPPSAAFSIFGEDGAKKTPKPARSPARAAWLKPALAAGIVLTVSAGAYWAWRHYLPAPAAVDAGRGAAASPGSSVASSPQPAAPVMTPVNTSSGPVPGPAPTLPQPRPRIVAPASITLSPAGATAGRRPAPATDVAPPSLGAAPARGVLDALAVGGSARAVPVLSGSLPATRISGGVHEGRVLSSVRPIYPDAARRIGLFGDVVLLLQVGEDGRVKDVQTRSGNPILATAATQAVRLWRYEPATLDGKPVTSTVEVTVKFTNSR